MKNSGFKLLLFFLFVLFFSVSEPIKASEIVNTYDGDLGYTYSNTRTTFTIWSSSASEIEIVVEGNVNERRYLSKDSTTNAWIAIIPGDLSGCEYYYNIRYDDGTTYEKVLDPYGKYLNSDKTKNMVFNDSVSYPETWDEVYLHLNIKDRNKIIYGINMETFTKGVGWNGDEVNKGKLLSLNQTGTSYNNVPTGFDHVRNLGVTYIEISNIVEQKNPFIIDNHYVSGSLSYSGTLELKDVVSSYYHSNIGVVGSFDLSFGDMFVQNLYKVDRVYYLTESGELNANSKMVKKYIKEVVTYWVEEYKLSGVNFTNMSEYSYSFINEICEELVKINENILIYGNGSYSALNDDIAGENNLSNLEGVRLLNGSLNYGMFGDVFSKEINGILDGNYSQEIKETLKFTLLSGINNGDLDYSLVNGISYKGDWGNTSPYQLINYLGTREGLSAYDKLFINNLTGNSIIENKMVLAFGTLMISGGVPYIEAGTEFLASYQNFDNEENSVCTDNRTFCFFVTAEDKVIDWSYVYDNKSIVNAFKSLANFRKRDTVAIQSSVDTIKKHVKIFFGEDGVVGFVRNYPNAYVDEAMNVLVVFNYSNYEYSIDDYSGKGWTGLYTYNLANREGGSIKMKGNSLYIDSQIKQHKVNQWVMLIIVVTIIGLIYYFNAFMNKKLVETRGYDIKDVGKKYRPFIKRGMKEKKDDGQKDNNESNDKKD